MSLVSRTNPLVYPLPKNALSRTSALLVLCLSLFSFNCQTGAIGNRSGERTAAAVESVPKYGYEVVNTFPHDTEAYTQGLVFHGGKLFESTGGHKSSLRSVELQTGKVERMVKVPNPYFAEGITLLNGKIYQLTWQHQKGFLYDASSFDKIGEFPYEGEGWGLANDGTSLILSDGSNRIRFLNPSNFQVSRTIAVFEGNAPVTRINELEYVRDEIYANIWHEERIARINPRTGIVVGWVDLTGLLKPGEVNDGEAVLNGIAYDETKDRLFVTGKLWPKLFEIRLVQMQGR